MMVSLFVVEVLAKEKAMNMYTADFGISTLRPVEKISTRICPRPL